VAIKDKSWQGVKRVEYFLDMIELVRKARLKVQIFKTQFAAQFSM